MGGVGHPILLRLEVGLRGRGATDLDGAHHLVDEQQRGVRGLGMLAHSGEDVVPQGDLADAERLHEVGQLDTEIDATHSMASGPREVRTPGVTPLVDAGEECPEHLPTVGLDLASQRPVGELAVGADLTPDRLGGVVRDLVDATPDPVRQQRRTLVDCQRGEAHRRHLAPPCDSVTTGLPRLWTSDQ